MGPGEANLPDDLAGSNEFFGLSPKISHPMMHHLRLKLIQAPCEEPKWKLKSNAIAARSISLMWNRFTTACLGR